MVDREPPAERRDATEPADSATSLSRRISALPQRVRPLLDPHVLRRRADAAHASGRRVRATLWRHAAVFNFAVRRSLDRDTIHAAAALTYHSLLALVPILAVAFALFKAFGGLKTLQEPLKEVLLRNFAVGTAQQVGAWLDRFIQNINAGAIAGVGVLLLFYTAINMLIDVERTFNRLWGIERSRPLYLRLAMYWFILTMSPPLVALSVSLSSRLQQSHLVAAVDRILPIGVGGLLTSLGSVAAIVVALMISYAIVPNARVRPTSALAGGLVAGLLWHLSKALFLWLTASSVKYNAIYGTLGALPLLMIWLDVSWNVVLFGVSYSFASQVIAKHQLEWLDQKLDAGSEESLATQLMVATTRAFVAAEKLPDGSQLARDCGVGDTVANRLLARLVSVGLLHEVAGDHAKGYVPARDPRELTLADVTQAIRGGDAGPPVEALEPDAEIDRRLRRAEKRWLAELATTTIYELATVERKPPRSPRERPAHGRRHPRSPLPHGA